MLSFFRELQHATRSRAVSGDDRYRARLSGPGLRSMPRWLTVAFFAGVVGCDGATAPDSTQLIVSVTVAPASVSKSDSSALVSVTVHARNPRPFSFDIDLGPGLLSGPDPTQSRGVGFQFGIDDPLTGAPAGPGGFTFGQRFYHFERFEVKSHEFLVDPNGLLGVPVGSFVVHGYFGQQPAEQPVPLEILP